MGESALRRLCWLGATQSLLGAWVARATLIFRTATDPSVPQLSNFYQYTFSHYEPVALYASAVAFAVLALVLRRPISSADRGTRLAGARYFPFMAAAIVIVAAWLGRLFVCHQFDLSIDEWLNDFEVKILAQHHLVASVPAQWRDFAPAMKVPFQNYNAVDGYWASGFLPGFASLDFLAKSLGLDGALSPILAGLSLLFLASVARRLFPTSPTFAANLAVVLLAVSPQFLAMAMTKFVWTAQLCGCLFWLWLLTHPRRPVFLFTPVFGALLIGLHQPHVHPLIAAPFVFRFLLERRWGVFAWFSGWYVLGAACWYPVFAMLRPAALDPGGDLHNFVLGNSIFIEAILSLLFALFHAITLLAWTTPAIFPLVGLCLLTWKSQPAVIRDGAAAIVLTFLFYLSFPHPQGHGWGYRYLHAAYGLLVLAATAGGVVLRQQNRQVQLWRAVAVSVVFSVAVQLPYRAHEIDALTRPLALTSNYIETRPSDFVIIETSDFWYSWDLVRNDPWLLQRPLVFNGARLTSAQRAELYRRGSVTVVGANEVRTFGVILADPAKKAP
jgi:hypothetical protein